MTGPGTRDVSSDMAALVIVVLVAEGDVVNAGQDLVILESMKMEVPVTADAAGRVSEVLVAAGDAIDGGQVLLRLDMS